MDRIKKALIYIFLSASALLFCIPFLWMLSTALKPLEQTMTMPPTWLPYRYYIQKAGEQVPVRLLERLDKTAFILVSPEGKKTLSFKKAEINTVTRVIPASKTKLFYKIIPEKSSKRTEWEVMPASKITTKIEARWKNFANAIKAMKFFPHYLKNTLILCVLTVTGTVASSSLVAYGFARIDWRGRDKVFLIVLATMMIPFPVVMVPLYCMFRQLNMLGTLQPLWVGSFCAPAFNIFLLRQFLIGIPKDLSDAARIDGCSEFTIFWKIILPISKPALTVVALFQFMATWNDFLGPLIYLTDQKDFTLALGLQFFQSQHGGTEWNYLMAASILILLPVLILFFFAQKQFIEGISMTGLKG